jgi:hypothetical protein
VKQVRFTRIVLANKTRDTFSNCHIEVSERSEVLYEKSTDIHWLGLRELRKVYQSKIPGEAQGSEQFGGEQLGITCAGFPVWDGAL